MNLIEARATEGVLVLPNDEMMLLMHILSVLRMKHVGMAVVKRNLQRRNQKRRLLCQSHHKQEKGRQ